MSAINFVDYFFRKINGVKRVQFDAYLERQSGEGTYLFANGLPIGMATPGDCQGIKMEFDYGVTPDVTGTGKGVVGLDIKMTMDQDWDFTPNQYNATVRAARLQVVSEDDVSGRIEGAYINAIAEGTKAIEGYISGLTGPGIIGVEARTEIQTSATITTPSAVGVLIFSRVKASATLTGKYRGLQIEMPMLGAAASISDTTCGIYLGADWGGADIFDYGLYITAGTCAVGIYATATQIAANDSFTFYGTNTSTAAAGYHRTVYVLTDHDGDMTASASMESLGVDLVIQDDVPSVRNISCWTGFYSSATMSEWAALYAHADALVSTGAMINMLDMNMVTSTRTTHSNMAFLGCYAHTGSSGMKQVIWLQGTGEVADYLVEEYNAAGTAPHESGDITSGKTCIGGFRCKVGGTVGVIPLYSD